MITGYFVRYRLYDVNNTFFAHSFSQYSNWSAVMEENFPGFFEIVDVATFTM